MPDVKDSKKLTPQKRDILYDELYTHAIAIGVGIVDSYLIDRINILKAALLSMALAAENLYPKPDLLLIDGPYKIPSNLEQSTIIKGDSLSVSIAAASIIAKVSRDRLMEGYHLLYPEYGFYKHKGYPSKAHKEAIAKYGCSKIHRLSFKPCKLKKM